VAREVKERRAIAIAQRDAQGDQIGRHMRQEEWMHEQNQDGLRHVYFQGNTQLHVVDVKLSICSLKNTRHNLHKPSCSAFPTPTAKPSGASRGCPPPGQSQGQNGLEIHAYSLKVWRAFLETTHHIPIAVVVAHPKPLLDQARTLLLHRWCRASGERGQRSNERTTRASERESKSCTTRW